MSDNNKFEQMLKLAEFSVKRMEERRAFEFKIFISYITLLVLALYQLIKPGNPVHVFFQRILQKEPSSLESWEGFILYLLALLMHITYVMWQIGVGIAMENDARRRNFYLKKAENISGKSLNYVENSEPLDDAFFEKEIVIIEHYLQQVWHFDLIWKDWSRMLIVAIPTILFIIIVDLSIRKFHGSIDICFRISAVLIPLIPILIGLITWIVRKKRRED